MDLVVHLEHNLAGHHAFHLLESSLTPSEKDRRKLDFHYVLQERYTKTVKARDDIGAGQLASPMVGTLDPPVSSPEIQTVPKPKHARAQRWVVGLQHLADHQAYHGCGQKTSA
ncbi:hypothetical protein B0T25DRAFT_574147 [Lasiosphaeria hispida]|uniref:Uncharacterized protein n=1 Tax=Lasiosphaeria hispida TaxID=260671 RepID=A0AAJ0M8H4_9PEZI|nr:hypothetical protein B0T25DRAFT_574147 [Lasiosphaeria hispida]